MNALNRSLYDGRASKAFHMYRKVFNSPSFAEGMVQFAAFLGDPYDGERTAYVNIHNPDVLNKIDMILGPHGMTILKMWKAQQEPDDGASKATQETISEGDL